MPDDVAVQIRGTGDNLDDEYGAATRRPRDCGWFDAVLVRSACFWSGVTRVTLTKLDKLSALAAIPVASSWNLANQKYLFMPPNPTLIDDPRLIVDYVSFPGWQKDIRGIRSWPDLPPAAQNYVLGLEELINDGAAEEIRIDRIGVGPGENDFIDR
jgi:adenylosuccinate synthase